MTKQRTLRKQRKLSRQPKSFRNEGHGASQKEAELKQNHQPRALLPEKTS